MALLLQFPNNLSMTMTCVFEWTAKTHPPPPQIIPQPRSFNSFSGH